MKDRITELHRIWDALADFSALQGYDGWMIGSAVLRRTAREAEACDGVRSRIASEDARRGNFAVMKHSVACGDLLYTLELHVVKPKQADDSVGDVRKTVLRQGDDSNIKYRPLSGADSVDASGCVPLSEKIRFSASEILEFTEAVGDTNPIHRTANPVVPGLLIFRKFLECVQEDVSGQDMTWRMRFLQPLLAEETVQVYRQNGKDGRVTYSGYETKRGVCIWNVHIS